MIEFMLEHGQEVRNIHPLPASPHSGIHVFEYICLINDLLLQQ